jgi:DNA-binding IclR family transcriptional regulator
VFLSIIVGRSRVNVDWIEARGRRVSASQRGRSVPLHCTTMSRALLAYLDDREIADYLASAAPLTRYDAIFPETANATAQDVWDDIARIRRDGFITWRNPQQYGANYIAFPVLDGGDRPHALITVGGPLERFGPQRIAELMSRMRAVLLPLQQHCRHVPAAPVIIEGS